MSVFCTGANQVTRRGTLFPVMLGLLLVLLVGCAGRGQVPDPLPRLNPLEEKNAQEILMDWSQRLGDYIELEGNGDPTVLSQIRDKRSRHRQRPALITFSALDLRSDFPGMDGWDATGVLVGLASIAGEDWYVFLVGSVKRANYRPVGIQDIRLVAFSAEQGKLRWRFGERNLGSLLTYSHDIPVDSLSVKFPDDRDQFAMMVRGNRVMVQEENSRAEWLLQLYDE